MTHPYVRSPLPSPILRTPASEAGRKPAHLPRALIPPRAMGIKGLDP